MSTLAGAGSAGAADGDGPAASFAGPFGVSAARDGTIYVANAQNHSIRKITPTGTVSTRAGTESAGAADGVVKAQVSLRRPFGVAMSAGNTYVTDGLTLRRIAADGSVTTVLRGGQGGNLSDIDGQADCWGPVGLAVANNGTIYVADAWNRIIYASDTGNHDIRKITPAGVVTTFAGTGIQGRADGAAATASFDSPSALALDGLGNLYVFDSGNFTIRKIGAEGVVTTLAGSGAQGYADGKSTAATFEVIDVIDGIGGIGGIVANRDGTLYESDTYNNTIRWVLPDGTVSTLAGQAGQAGAANGAVS